MNNQVALAGFEAPHEKEASVFREIGDRLSDAAVSVGAAPGSVSIRHGKGYSSVWACSILAFRLCLRKSRYIEVPMDAKAVISGLVPESEQKEVPGGYWRVKLGDMCLDNYAGALVEAVKNAVNRIPKDWDCCSRYQECSDAKYCIHPDPAFALSCGYRKILNSGRIYYGKNRNVD